LTKEILVLELTKKKKISRLKKNFNLKAKKKIPKFQIFHHICKNIIFKKNKKSSKKETKINPSRYYYNSSITNLKFQHKPKYYYFSKILI